jgi:multidrug resistance efflux pump
LNQEVAELSRREVPQDPTPHVHSSSHRAMSMADSFPRTIRALQSDGMNPAVLGLILVTGLIAFWCVWLVLGRVSIYEISATARLESERVHPVAATVGGRVVSSYLSLARDVRRGDVLLEIESDREQLETVEERRRLATLDTALAAFKTQIPAEEQAIALASHAARVALSQTSQNLAVVEATVRQADDQYRRARLLSEEALVAEVDVASAKNQLDARQADLRVARLGVERLRAEQVVAERERRAHLGALLRERATLEGQRADAAAGVTSREREAEERRIRAAVDGHLGEIAPLQVGAMVREGERIASIVGPGPVKIVAEFLPPALGRVRAGQPARLRLDGFPWTQYGHVTATVQSVATETREGRVRVELTVNQARSSIPLEHGLPGAVEVEVERVAPVALLVRTLGYALTQADVRIERAAAAEHHTP